MEMTIKSVRKSKGITQIELAAKLGISTSTLSLLENGKVVYKSTLVKVCEELGIDPDNVVGVKIRGK